VVLPEASQEWPEGLVASVAGWGRAGGEGNPYSDVLQQVSVPIISDISEKNVLLLIVR